MEFHDQAVTVVVLTGGVMQSQFALAHMRAAILQDRVVLIQDPMRKGCADGWEFYGSEHINAPMYIQHMLRQYEAITYRSPCELAYEAVAMRNELFSRIARICVDTTDKTVHAKNTNDQISRAKQQNDKQVAAIHDTQLKLRNRYVC